MKRLVLINEGMRGEMREVIGCVKGGGCWDGILLYMAKS
jgi:hypothetical protein